MSGLGPDDIEAMHDPDIEAAYEAARRGVKGLPADRLYDGTIGATRLWRGILKLGAIIADQADVIARFEAYERARNQGATEIYPEDSKYKT